MCMCAAMVMCQILGGPVCVSKHQCQQIASSQGSWQPRPVVTATGVNGDPRAGSCKGHSHLDLKGFLQTLNLWCQLLEHLEGSQCQLVVSGVPYYQPLGLEHRVFSKQGELVGVELL